MSWHIGRSWSGNPIEDECPCPQAPCGLVIDTTVHAECDQHGLQATKTIRQSHLEQDCPALPQPERRPMVGIQ